MKRLSALLSLLVLLPTRVAWTAEDEPSGASAAPGKVTTTPDSVTDSSDQPGASDGETSTDGEDEAPAPEGMEIDWKGPLKLFDLGQVDEALASLRKQVLECGDPEDGTCDKPQFATLYGSIGVVLAGSGDHLGGVRAFRRALTYTDVRLLPAYRTPEIERALAEARGETSPAAPAGGAPPANTAATPAPPEASTPAPKPLQGKAFFMLSGLGQAGIVSDGVSSAALARLGGAITVASRTGEGMFTMGLRGWGASLVGRGALGSIGGTVLLGGMGIPQYRNRFGFILGGIGIDHIPNARASAVAFDFLMGRAFGGGTIALSTHSAFDASGYLNTVGIELGFGGLSSAN